MIAGIVLGLMTDVIRLGPSEVTLPADALIVTLEPIRGRDIDPVWDYYYLTVTISNRVTDPAILPYEAEVTLLTNPDAVTLGYFPSRDNREESTRSFLNVDRIFHLPAGTVGFREPTPGTAHWTARGESFGNSRPIFRTVASYVLEVRIGEGTTPSLSSVVTLTWYYQSAVQAHPVATRTTTASIPLSPSGLPST